MTIATRQTRDGKMNSAPIVRDLGQGVANCAHTLRTNSIVATANTAIAVFSLGDG
jgi:hypothetical protein